MSSATDAAIFHEPLLRTPFHERARALTQVDSFIAWAGYTTVDVFTTVEQEYFAIRNATTLYDLTPMVKYRIVGPMRCVLESPGHSGSGETQTGSRGLLRMVQR